MRGSDPADDSSGGDGGDPPLDVVAPPDEPTLPVYIYNQLRFGFTPTINAVFTLIGLVSVLLVVGATIILRKETGQSGGNVPGA